MKASELKHLADALLRANESAMTKSGVDDGGSCNFDTAVIKLRGIRAREAEQLPVRLSKITSGYWKGWYFVFGELWGQGNRRTAMAEAMAKSLENDGYESAVYYQLD